MLDQTRQAGHGQTAQPFVDPHPWLWRAALIVGAAYWLHIWFGWQGPLITAWKGASVGLLAVWAWRCARTRDSRQIAWVMTLGAVGDVLLDAINLPTGALAFAAAHLVAIILYLRNRRPNPSPSQKGLAYLLVPAALLICWGLVRGENGASIAILYTGFVSLMAATAWLSRFPRYRTGIGALLFVLSDLLIFAREGGSIAPQLGSLLVWPTYFAAQALIVRGVIGAELSGTRWGVTR